jgi:hypothetical protein
MTDPDERQLITRKPDKAVVSKTQKSLAIAEKEVFVMN